MSSSRTSAAGNSLNGFYSTSTPRTTRDSNRVALSNRAQSSCGGTSSTIRFSLPQRENDSSVQERILASLQKLEAAPAALSEEQKVLGNKFQALEDKVKLFVADQEEQAGKTPIPKDVSVSEHEPHSKSIMISNLQ